MSSLEDESLIFSYLSDELVSRVKKLPNVKACVPDFKVSTTSNETLESIKSSTEWKNVCVRGNTYNHLSLISQGKFDETIHRNPPDLSYDKNYYYPSSSGEGINVFILDAGFNFRHPEFSDKNSGRKVECLVTFDQDEYLEEHNDICMHGHNDHHGSKMASIIGGKTYGVASKVNIYGIGVRRNENQLISSFIYGLEYINNNYLSKQEYKYKTIINMSSAFDKNEISNIGLSMVNYYGNLIKEMSNKGAVFVVSAGNQGKIADNVIYPCSFDSVICVGAIDNVGINDISSKIDEMKNSNHDDDDEDWKKEYDRVNSIFEDKIADLVEKKTFSSRNYVLASFSNYGNVVDIYAPGHVKVYYQDENRNNTQIYATGTSYSTPIVAGVAATIMSEETSTHFTTDSMLSYLKSKGLKNTIKEIPSYYPNIFLNNGNNNSFVQYSEYNSCGNNQVCGNSNELNCYLHGCCIKE